jgi:hypothetical protein
LLVGWAGYAYWFEAYGAHHDWRLKLRYRRDSAYWRFGTQPPERLRRCVVGLEPEVPAGEPVYLWDPGNDFYRWRWAAYFLPGREVLPAGPGAPAGTLVVVTARTGPPGASLVAGGRWCGLYRLP